MRARIVVFSLILALPAVLSAAHLGDFYVIPVAGHAAGANATMWHTDIALHNFQSVPITIEVGVIETGEGAQENFFPLSMGGPSTLTVPAGGTVILTDVLNNHRGQPQTVGALLLGGDRSFAVTSRTYAIDASGSSRTGQSVPATQAMLSSSEEEAFLPGVMANTQFRTNIGFTGSARRGAPLVIEVAILGAEGATLGTRTFTVPAGAVNHLQFSSAAITTTPFDEGTARVRIVSGDGEVVSYASVVENASNNAIFISSIVPGANGANATSSSFAEKLRSLF